MASYTTWRIGLISAPPHRSGATSYMDGSRLNNKTVAWQRDAGFQSHAADDRPAGILKLMSSYRLWTAGTPMAPSHRTDRVP
jgi:hypothetical protein